MKRLFLPIVFLAFFQLAGAQVSDQDVPSKSRGLDDQDRPDHSRQVITGDLTVYNSECVGADCATVESYGAITIMMKENNTRIRFWDTSNSGSFPSTDWELEANEQNNGGANQFALVDLGAAGNENRKPFIVRAGAPTNSLFVASSGDLGIGTGNPVVELHVADGDSPALRLEQNGSSGFTPQTWDIAGNETNFFVRDVTNGSRLPFKIFPSAPTNSLTIKSDGNVGIGTNNPDAKLHISSTTASVDELFHVQGAGTVLTRLESSNGGALQFRMKTDNDLNRRILGETNAGVQQSQIALRDAGIIDFYGGTTATFTRLTTGSTGLTASSSRSLKDNISKLEIPDILDRISEVPVTKYNWKKDLVGEEISRKEVIGLIAQDFYNVLERGNNTEINGQDVQMALWLGVQQLHNNDKILDEELQQKEARILALEKEVDELKNQISEISELLKYDHHNILLEGIDRPSLGQNRPNPYNNETTIEYYVPKNSESAEIQFRDLTGKLLRRVEIKTFEKGVINLRVQDLPQGSYQYTLLVDGKITESKQMIIAR